SDVCSSDLGGGDGRPQPGAAGNRHFPVLPQPAALRHRRPGGGAGPGAADQGPSPGRHHPQCQCSRSAARPDPGLRSDPAQAAASGRSGDPGRGSAGPAYLLDRPGRFGTGCWARHRFPCRATRLCVGHPAAGRPDPLSGHRPGGRLDPEAGLMDSLQLRGIGMTSPRARERLLTRLYEAGIRDLRVLETMRNTPRHIFVDEALASRAYDDTALPIGFGQTISQPYMVARMTEALLDGHAPERVLEVGTGSGYQTAVLAQLVPAVFSIERIRGLLDLARSRFRTLRLY